MLSACAQTETTATLQPPSDLAASDAPEQAQPLPILRDMIGLDRDQITALFGTPHFRRLDKPADLWQYSNKECALDLFLYRIRDGTTFKVTHAEVRLLNKAQVTKSACFKNLIKYHIGQMQKKNTGVPVSSAR